MATVQQVDAVVLSGGSAFGLAAADGVMAELELGGRGFETEWGNVPIVVGMSLFDLAVGEAGVRPGAADGAAAARVALGGGEESLGLVGAGTGATTGKWRGEDSVSPGGLVGAHRSLDGIEVAALVAVNSWGDVLEPGATAVTPDWGNSAGGSSKSQVGLNTTIGVVATNVSLDKVGCQHLARGAHDGLARAVDPPHATIDGDAFVALSCGDAEAPLDVVRHLAIECVDTAIRSLHSR
jgi:L-aminopeptidase/D-esterase-like protein